MCTQITGKFSILILYNVILWFMKATNQNFTIRILREKLSNGKQ